MSIFREKTVNDTSDFLTRGTLKMISPYPNKDEIKKSNATWFELSFDGDSINIEMSNGINVKCPATGNLFIR